MTRGLKNILRSLLTGGGVAVAAVLLLTTGCQAGSTIETPEVTSEEVPATATPDEATEVIEPQDADIIAEAISEAERWLVFNEVTPPVEVISEDAAAHTAAVGELVMTGTTIRSGDGGQAVLALDDGTLLVISSNAEVSLTALQQTTQSPLTRLFLQAGELFAMREGVPPLDDEALFEIETSHGVAGIRGTSMLVSFGENTAADTDNMVTVCLTGTCDLRSTITANAVQLQAGERSEATPEGDVLPPEPATEDELQRGQEAFEAAQQAAERTLPPSQQVEPQSIITLCHATSDPEQPYERLTISYAAADGHGHEDHGEDIIPAPDDGCPQPEPTPVVEGSLQSVRLRPASNEATIEANRPVTFNLSGWAAEEENIQEAIDSLSLTFVLEGTTYQADMSAPGACPNPIEEMESPVCIFFTVTFETGLAPGTYDYTVFYDAATALGDGANTFGPGTILEFSGTVTVEEGG